MTILGIIIIIVVAILLIISIIFVRIVKPLTVVIIERSGVYYRTLKSGIRLLLPNKNDIFKLISLKEKLANFKYQQVLTKNNEKLQIEMILFYQISDAGIYTYGINEPLKGLEKLSFITLKSIVNKLNLDETIKNCDAINTRMRELLNEATNSWGIKINKVNLNNIIIQKEN